MASPTFWGTRFPINTTAQDDQIEPNLRALKNGTFLAVWEDMSATGADKSGSGIYGQFFNADGTKKGGEFLINSTTFGRQSAAQVVELNDGRFVVAWHDGGGGNVIRARHFNADGTPLGPDFQVNTSPVLGTADFSITALSNGGYAVAFLTINREVKVKGFTDSLAAKSEIIVATDKEGSLYNSPEIVAHEGGYTIVYGETTVNNMWVHNRAFSNDGSNPVNTTDFITPQTGTKYHPGDAAALTNGMTAIAWTEGSNAGGSSSTTIKVQLLKSGSSKHGSEIVVASSGDLFLHDPIITHLADGGFAVAYHKDVPGEPSSSDLSDIYLTTFDMNGTRVGPDMLVERMHAANYVKSLTTLSDGRVVVSWAADQGSSDPKGQELHARIVDPRQKAISLDGTSRDDQYIGTRFDDTLNGSAGADTLTGAEGNDTFYVDNAFDQVKESAGQGQDTVIASGSYRLDLAAEVEVLKLGSASNRAAYTLEGSNSANTIIGNAGANTLKGHGGNDKLYGGAGKDVLSGGTGQDIFLFDTRPNKNTNVDRITDFKGRDDAFHLDNAVFTKLGSGSAARPKKFSADMFVKGSKAQDREDRIVYDKKTGALYYDQDGTGSKAQVKIATLTNKSTLTYDDFFVI